MPKVVEDTFVKILVVMAQGQQGQIPTGQESVEFERAGHRKVI